jgi:hypothetical protein
MHVHPGASNSNAEERKAAKVKPVEERSDRQTTYLLCSPVIFAGLENGRDIADKRFLLLSGC